MNDFQEYLQKIQVIISHNQHEIDLNNENYIYIENFGIIPITNELEKKINQNENVIIKYKTCDQYQFAELSFSFIKERSVIYVFAESENYYIPEEYIDLSINPGMKVFTM